MRSMSSRSTGGRARLRGAASSAKRTWKAAAEEPDVVGVKFGYFVVGVVRCRSIETAADRFDPAPFASGVLADAEAAEASMANEWGGEWRCDSDSEWLP